MKVADVTDYNDDNEWARYLASYLFGKLDEVFTKEYLYKVLCEYATMEV